MTARAPPARADDPGACYCRLRPPPGFLPPSSTPLGPVAAAAAVGD